MTLTAPVLNTQGTQGWGHTAVYGGTFDWCHTRFCRESGKRRNYGLFVVVKSSNVPPENVKTRLKESNVPPLNNDFESKVPQLFILDSRTFVAKSALSRLRAFCGALLAKMWWEGAQKHLKGPGRLLQTNT